MSTLPLFPLNTVLFPGISVPLRVFEDRYRALVHELLRIEDPTERVFGSCAIREGYEVGSRGGQSLHRIGCILQMTEVDEREDGTFDIVAVGRSRLRLGSLETTGAFLSGEIEVLLDDKESVEESITTRARQMFSEYRLLLSSIRGEEVLSGDLPRDPAYLSWTLSAICLLTLSQRQALLEAESATARLMMLTDMLHEEVRAMTALPSLPATEVSRTQWSPN